MLNSKVIYFLFLVFLTTPYVHAQQALYEVDPTREVDFTSSSSPSYFDSSEQYLFFFSRYLRRLDKNTGEIFAIPGSEKWRGQSIKSYAILANNIISLRLDGLYKSDLDGNNEQKLANYIPAYSVNGRTIEVFSTGSFVYFYYEISIENVRVIKMGRTDGTIAGTETLDLCDNDCTPTFEHVTKEAGNWYFTVIDKNHLHKIWTFNRQGKPLPLIQEKISSQKLENGLTAVGNSIYFISEDSEKIRSLWKKQGENIPTKFEIKSSSGAIYFPSSVTSINNTLLVHRRFLNLLHINAATAEIVEIIPQGQYVSMEGAVYFPARTDLNPYPFLWRTDGTVKGTKLVSNKIRGEIKIIGSKGNKLFVHVADPTTYPVIEQLWVTDGTEIGTFKLDGVNTSEEYINLQGFMFFNEALYFTGKSEQSGFELWRSDGSQLGTHKVIELGYSTSTVQSGPIFTIGNQFYTALKRTDYVDYNWVESTGFESFYTDTLEKRQVQIPLLEDRTFDDWIETEKGFFWWQSLGSSTGQSLYYFDSATEEVNKVADLAQTYGAYNDFNKIVLNENLYFVSKDESIPQLWTSDGSTLTQLTHFITEQEFPDDVDITSLTKDGDYVYFSLLPRNIESTLRSSIWRSDGTVEGTKELININKPEFSRPPLIGSRTVNSGNVYFTSYTLAQTPLQQLWRFSNSELKVIASGDQNYNILGTFRNGIVYNNAEATWFLDNNSDTPQLFFNHALSNIPRYFYALPDKSAFVYQALNVKGEYKLWLSDGSAIGTKPIIDLLNTPIKFHGQIGSDLYYSIIEYLENSQNIQLWRYSLINKSNEFIYSQPASYVFNNFEVAVSENRVFISGRLPATSTFNRSRVGGPIVTARLGEGDLDNDGVNDPDDAFPLHQAEHADFDHDGVGDISDTDDDNDGINDDDDLYPFNGAEWRDSDHDGVGDVSDLDDDNDGVVDWQDAYPYDATRSKNEEPTVPSTGNGSGNSGNSSDAKGGGSLEFALLSLLLLTLVNRRNVYRK